MTCSRSATTKWLGSRCYQLIAQFILSRRSALDVMRWRFSCCCWRRCRWFIHSTMTNRSAKCFRNAIFISMKCRKSVELSISAKNPTSTMTLATSSSRWSASLVSGSFCASCSSKTNTSSWGLNCGFPIQITRSMPWVVFEKCRVSDLNSQSISVRSQV